MLPSGAGSYTVAQERRGDGEGGGGWQQAKQAEAWLGYLHVRPACPFSLLKLFVFIRGERRRDQKWRHVICTGS